MDNNQNRILRYFYLMNLILDLKINQFYQYHQVNKLKHVIFLMIIDYQLNDIDVNV